jgi:acetyl-CoA decarbonylase/synthase complex subunit epsilon
MATDEAWMRAEVAGPKRASVITKAEVAVAMMKLAKRPLMVAGHLSLLIDIDGERLIDYLAEISRRAGLPIVATAQTAVGLREKGIEPAAVMPIMVLADRLCDPSWKGVDDKGQHDLMLIAGLPYYLEWIVLSGLKNFAPGLKTITLDNVYHPNASWSLANLSVKAWREQLISLIDHLQAG